MRRRLALLAVAPVLLMAACGSDDADTSATSEPTVPSTSGPAFTTVPGSVSPVTTRPGGGASTTAPVGGTPEEQAIADLAAREGVEPSEITTVSVEEVTWRDGSMGCPEPGMNYTQALVPGIRVVLELDGQEHAYHAGGGRSIFLCENPEPPLDG